jgi:hypothetical protein
MNKLEEAGFFDRGCKSTMDTQAFSSDTTETAWQLTSSSIHSGRVWQGSERLRLWSLFIAVAVHGARGASKRGFSRSGVPNSFFCLDFRKAPCNSALQCHYVARGRAEPARARPKRPIETRLWRNQVPGSYLNARMSFDF